MVGDAHPTWLLQNFARQLGLRCRFSPEVLDLMGRYHWPGNVRELRNVLERSALLAAGGEIRPEHLNLAGGAATAGGAGPSPTASGSFPIPEDWYIGPAPDEPELSASRPVGGEMRPEHPGYEGAGGVADPGQSPAASGPGLIPEAGHAGPAQQMKDIERLTIEQALQRNGGNKAATARELGMSLSTLKRRIASYGL